MKIDLYTKIVLTVIAACLLCLVFRDQPLVATAHAQTAEIAPMKVDVVAVNGTPLTGNSYSGTLPVRVTNPVSIVH